MTRPDPDDPDRLEQALRLTDSLEQTAGAETREPTPGGLGVLADISAAFRAQGTGARPASAAVLFHWGPLEVRRPLGHGSFGEVFAAWDPSLEREVALKLRRPEAGTLRWLDEARSLARVRHPNVVTVFGADLRDNRAGMWTEFVDGETLEELVASRGPFEPREAMRIGRDLASALGAVHRTGLVHGDLKASNVMLERRPDGVTRTMVGGPAARRVVLMDFGSASPNLPGDDGAARFATPLYAAPEVLERGSTSAAADLYALGVLLYRLVSGYYPIEAKDPDELRARQARGERVPLARRRRGLPRDLVRVIERALSPSPGDRFGTASAMRDALARALGERVPVPLRALGFTAGAVVAVAAMAAGAWAIYLDHEAHDTEHFVVPPPPVLAMPVTPAWISDADSLDTARGWVVRIAPDLTGDGWPDAVVVDQGYPSAPGFFGRVMVYAGGPNGLSRHPVWTFLLPGDLPSLEATAVGDFNGDGLPDLVVTWHEQARPYGHPGGALMFAGTAHGLAHEPSWRRAGEPDYSAFGEETCAGDVNGDGISDLLIGEHDWSRARRDQGRVLVFLGSKRGLPSEPSQVIADEPQRSRFGQGFCVVGDVNRDGFNDVAIGAPQWSGPGGQTGCIKLYLGSPRGLLPARCPPIVGEEPGEGMGRHGSFVGIGDVNGDGYADLAAAAPGHDGLGMGVGEVRVYLGGPNGWRPRPVWRVAGEGSNCDLGTALATGDVDGDGVPDLVAGAPGFGLSPATRSAGAVFVYRGAGRGRLFDKRPAWWAWSGQADAGMGAVLTVGDANRDGRADILTMMPMWRRGSQFTGREVLFEGRAAPAGRAAP